MLETTASTKHRSARMPTWVPQAAKRYLKHTEAGLSIRALARAEGCHASTVLRQIRRFENLRDDLLVDEALRSLGRIHFPSNPGFDGKETAAMKENGICDETAPSEEVLACDGRRILRRLCENGAVLAVAAEMDKAVVVRDTEDGRTTRTAVVDRNVARAMALKDWIVCKAPGRISRYHITAAGRNALNHLIASAENAATGFAEAQTPFEGTQMPWGETREDMPEDDGKPRRVRYNLGESPLVALARRRDKDGSPFLEDSLVRAGERLREDFELAQMGTRVTQDWERFLTGGVQGSPSPSGGSAGSDAAKARVMGALKDLGPGLGDVALRCCCYLEGLEAAEKRMGWSARSGKIVLRIALQRLKRHYDDLGDAGAMIG